MWHPVGLPLIFAAKYTQVEALYTYIILFENLLEAANMKWPQDSCGGREQNISYSKKLATM